MAKRRKKRKNKLSLLSVIVAVVIIAVGGYLQYDTPTQSVRDAASNSSSQTISAKQLAKLNYSGQQIIKVNQNKPTFSQSDLSIAHGSWQKYHDLDQLNRVGAANAMLGKDIMPKTERDPLYVDPTGWHNKQVHSDGKTVWLYNRSHLIGYQLTGQNNNLKNLMTGTVSLNSPGMENYENEIADYLKDTNHHVRYEVEPIFRDQELLPRGVHMMAQSVEDKRISFNIYIFNVQDDVTLNYSDGTSTN
ncbi:DNA-entry nuclease [Paucilactobacillus hokkaidonensis JCM 18461]|uniref:DNA-entry nuclease n=1 Tax=Paucilactobacillus hokkaidonensis JCM 18461 TaxID=1291742 RepID=A0A0A1GXF9_9LACO|nr:DNA/RNA non-specific endonuclease [Paucilactobacillus hokkaidonensis]BAP86760.1 DNA-entry nuclease [Paucilactobacillus hokkaidonensis JCM 18461]